MHKFSSKSLLAVTALFLLLISALAAQQRHPSSMKLSREQKAHLLDGEFIVLERTDAIPGEVKKALATELKEEKLALANPGDEFNPGDVGRPGRRLIFAGISKDPKDRCFIHYEQGGIALMNRVVVFRLNKNGPATLLWAGSGFRAPDLNGLRFAVAAGRFVEVR